MTKSNLDVQQGNFQNTSQGVAKVDDRGVSNKLVPKNDSEATRYGHSDEHCDMVIEKNLPFHSIFEQEFVYFSGIVHIAYLPKKYTIETETLTKLIDSLTRKFQIQVLLTKRLADQLCRYLNTDDVAVLIEADHLPMDNGQSNGRNNTSVTGYYSGQLKSQYHKEAFLCSVRN